MLLKYSSRFKKQYKKLDSKLQTKVKKKIELLIVDEFNSILRNHSLSGKYHKQRSIDITGDYRLVYKRKNDIFYFSAVGTHSQLYK